MSNFLSSKIQMQRFSREMHGIFCVCVCNRESERERERERGEEFLHINLPYKYTVPMKHFSIDLHKHLTHLPQKLTCSPKFQFDNRQFNKAI